MAKNRNPASAGLRGRAGIPVVLGSANSPQIIQPLAEIQAAPASTSFNYGDLATMLERYNPEKLQHGYNTIDGEEVFFIANPGLGLWAYRGRFQ